MYYIIRKQKFQVGVMNMQKIQTGRNERFKYV